jgi:hypothetical protein
VTACIGGVERVTRTSETAFRGRAGGTDRSDFDTDRASCPP